MVPVAIGAPWAPGGTARTTPVGATAVPPTAGVMVVISSVGSEGGAGVPLGGTAVAGVTVVGAGPGGAAAPVPEATTIAVPAAAPSSGAMTVAVSRDRRPARRPRPR